jgi:hypothetical protein
MLARALRKQGIALRRNKKASNKADLALKLYDNGTKGIDIIRQTQMTTAEVVTLLIKRGLNLRTGLPPRVTKRSLDLAVEMYKSGEPLENVEIDTLVPRIPLLAELKNRGIELRP